MPERKFTLLELHLGDSTLQFGPSRHGPERGPGEQEHGPEHVGEEGTDIEIEGEEGDVSEGSGSGLRMLLALVALAGIAFAVRKMRGGDDDLEDLEDLDEMAAEL